MEESLYIVFVIFGLVHMGVGILQIINNSYAEKHEKKHEIKSVINIIIGIVMLIFAEIIFEVIK